MRIVVGCLSVASAAPSFYGLVSHPNGAVVPVDEPAVAAARADHLNALGAVAAPVAHAAYAAAPVAHAAYAAAPAVAAPVAHAAYAAAPAVAAPVVPAAYAAAPVAAAPAAYHTAYAGPLNLNTQLVAHPNGAVVPADEPAVVAARADHLASKGAIAYAAPAVAPAVHAAPAPAVHAAYAAAPAVHAAYAAVPAVPAVAPAHYGLVAHPNGAVVPADEPAVVEARAAHLNAL